MNTFGVLQQRTDALNSRMHAYNPAYAYGKWQRNDTSQHPGFFNNDKVQHPRLQERRGESLANGEHSSLALNFILGITTRAHDGYRKFLKIGLHMIF